MLPLRIVPCSICRMSKQGVQEARVKGPSAGERADVLQYGLGVVDMLAPQGVCVCVCVCVRALVLAALGAYARPEMGANAHS
eukprot:1160362-Pelagomonas_calceolata.AAC.5